MKDFDYVYATSNLKCLENRMLKQEDFLRMLEAGSSREAEEMLFDSGYFSRAEQGKSIDELLREKELEAFETVKDFGVPELDLFILQNDFYNIKASLKCVYENTDPAAYLKKPASGWTYDIYEKVRENDFSGFPKPFGEIISRGYSIMAESGSGRETEEYIDGEFYKTGARLSDKAFFKSWFELLGRLRSIDTEAQNRKLEFLKSRKSNVFDVDPVFGFYYGMLSEVRNLRTVLFGKRAGIDPDIIKERLCITYV